MSFHRLALSVFGSLIAVIFVVQVYGNAILHVDIYYKQNIANLIQSILILSNIVVLKMKEAIVAAVPAAKPPLTHTIKVIIKYTTTVVKCWTFKSASK